MVFAALSTSPDGALTRMAKVLVVDDKAANRDLLSLVLEHAGHQPVEAADGVEALAQVRAHRPDLVICDIVMPTMDGYEFVRRLRADSDIAHTEVVFCTATFLEREARGLAQSCGVSHILTKPFESKTVLLTVERVLADLKPAEVLPDAELFDREHVRLLTDKLVQKATELERANVRLSALTELNLQLASERDPQALLDKVCRGARDLIGARYAILGVKDATHPVLASVTTWGMATSDALKLKQLRMDVGIPRQVMQERTPRRFFNPGGDPLAVGLSAAYPAVHSGLIVPIVSPTQAHGWILLIDKLGADSFTEEDEHILSSHAAQAGRIYETGSLFVQAQRNAEKWRIEVIERKRAADELRESELRFRQLAESIREVFFLVEPADMRALYVSPAYEEIWGRTRESLYADPKSWRDAIHPADRARAHHGIAADGAVDPFDVEYRIVRPDGSLRWIRARSFPIRNEAGEVYRFAGIADDITDQVRLRDELREREEGLRHAQTLAKLAHIITRPDGSFESWSETLPGLLGVEAHSVPATTRAWLDILHPQDRERLLSKSIEAGASRLRVDVEYRLRRGDGEWLCVRQAIEPIPGHADAQGRTRWFCTLQDITEQKRVEQRVRRLNRVHAVLSGINTLIVRVRDRDELFREACRIAVDEGAYRLAWVGEIDPATLDGRIVASCGADEASVAKLRLSALGGSPHGDRPASRAVRQQVPVICNDIASADSPASTRDELLAQGLRSQACFPLIVNRQAAGVLTLCSAEVNAFDDDEVRLLLELANDIAYALDHIEKEERLTHLAYYDSLTGLANSSLLNERLEQYIATAGAERQTLALALVDLDRFKTINHSFGRHLGDALLKHVAERLGAWVGTGQQLARTGADLFAGGIPGSRSEADIGRMLADMYERHVVPPFEIDGKDLHLAAKIGVALYPGDGRDAETLYRNAEAALKKAKSGGDRVLFYDPRMTEVVSGQLALENKLRRALANEEFLLLYQPKVDVDTRRIESVEALVRWNSPELGLMAPAGFIPLMEETGLILELDAWVLRRAARDHKRWREIRRDPPRIAVNVSALQLRKADFVATVEATLDSGYLPHGVDVEIAESLVMEDMENTIGKLQGLRALGMNLSIDEFGTGYSSLAHLSRIPVQMLKIDRTFVKTMLVDPTNLMLVSTMISLAHSLRMKVVAEGVETEAQANMLNLLRCDQMQGHLVSKPVAFDDMTILLRDDMKR